MLLPTFGLFGIALAADRYTYLPCLGWALLVAGSTLVGPRGAGHRSAFARYAVALAPVPIILVLAGLTWHQTGTWRASETLWTHALVVNPSSRAHLAMARVRTEQGRLVDAVYHDRKAIELRPDYDTAYNNLGNALARIGMLDEAVQRYQQAIELRPSYAEAYYNLGSTLLDAGRPAEALPYFSRAVQLNPDLTQAQRGLELALQRLGRSADTTGPPR
jgi:tetratricopeptide (TPR) repeat protein